MSTAAADTTSAQQQQQQQHQHHQRRLTAVCRQLAPSSSTVDQKHPIPVPSPPLIVPLLSTVPTAAASAAEGTNGASSSVAAASDGAQSLAQERVNPGFDVAAMTTLLVGNGSRERVELRRKIEKQIQAGMYIVLYCVYRGVSCEIGCFLTDD